MYTVQITRICNMRTPAGETQDPSGQVRHPMAASTCDLGHYRASRAYSLGRWIVDPRASVCSTAVICVHLNNNNCINDGPTSHILVRKIKCIIISIYTGWKWGREALGRDGKYGDSLFRCCLFSSCGGGLGLTLRGGCGLFCALRALGSGFLGGGGLGDGFVSLGRDGLTLDASLEVSGGLGGLTLGGSGGSLLNLQLLGLLSDLGDLLSLKIKEVLKFLYQNIFSLYTILETSFFSFPTIHIFLCHWKSNDV